MQYAQLNEDGTYSHQITTYGDIQWDENNCCSAETLVKDGKAHLFRIVELHETDPPVVDNKTHSVVRDGGEFVDGKWQYKWRIDELTTNQINEIKKINEKVVRSERNKRLSDTDWVVIRSIELNASVPQKYIVYRQALRDITLQPSFPYNITWPERP